ncbi:MAG TPA: hypothetical protein VFG20_18070 [Planctomycetaceae bacterium]|nr:hypothetical protein [Planctomycetaceae bacterium]
MSLTRQQLLAKSLAGTVSFPPTFPQLARISVVSSPLPVHGATANLLLRAEQMMSSTLSIIRTCSLSDVAGVFIPRDCGNVRLDDGLWLLGEEIAAHLAIHQHNQQQIPPLGIVRVAEHVSVFMQVEVGMTAAESAEYYPPLPCDRSHDHYQLQGPGATYGAPAVHPPNDCEPMRRTPWLCECESVKP